MPRGVTPTQRPAPRDPDDWRLPPGEWIWIRICWRLESIILRYVSRDELMQLWRDSPGDHDEWMRSVGPLAYQRREREWQRRGLLGTRGDPLGKEYPWDAVTPAVVQAFASSISVEAQHKWRSGIGQMGEGLIRELSAPHWDFYVTAERARRQPRAGGPAPGMPPPTAPRPSPTPTGPSPFDISAAGHEKRMTGYEAAQRIHDRGF